ncbi:MAG: molybdate ABC transporter substrate-binding protein [Rhodospirillales bacterium]|nr:molybdate ABC transporter substrate-binding protein [Rhodospirillales bacterium]
MLTIGFLNAAATATTRSAVRRRRIATAAGLLLAMLSAASWAHAADVRIFAAASTSNAIIEIGELAKGEGLPRMVSAFASSSALARQIANGAPADIYVSANVRWMEYLDNNGAIDRTSRIDLLGNSLVLIAPKGGRLAAMPVVGVIGRDYSLNARLAGGRLAIGDPAHVPAGIYGKQALISLGLWASVAERLAPAANVRGALVLVERGEAEAGIVYATDAAVVAGKVAVIGTFPASSHEPIIYPAAIVAGRDREDVRRVFAFLASAKAAAVFARHGFMPMAAKP